MSSLILSFSETLFYSVEPKNSSKCLFEMSMCSRSCFECFDEKFEKSGRPAFYLSVMNFLGEATNPKICSLSILINGPLELWSCFSLTESLLLG